MNLRKELLRAYWGAERVLVPGLKNSQLVYEEMLGQYVDRETRWLDLGCGHQLLPPWRAQEEERLARSCGALFGIDADMPSLRKHKTIQGKVSGSVTCLPFRASSFDLVTANMVVEHLDAPDEQFSEVARVLKPGGIFFFHTPNRLSYPILLARGVPDGAKRIIIRLLQNRIEEDVFPTYYRANTAKDIERVAANSGFSLVDVRAVISHALFANILPIAIVELFFIRLLSLRYLEQLRPNLLVVLRRAS